MAAKFIGIFVSTALESSQPVTRRVVDMDIIYLLGVGVLVVALVGLVHICAKLARPT